MSLQSLQIAQAKAAKLLGINISELDELRAQEVHQLGYVVLNGESYPALRAYTGPKGKIGKGGIRFAAYPSLEAGVDVAKELSGEMYAKLTLRNHHDFRGAKGLVLIDAWKLRPEEKSEVARQYEALMDKAGLAGYNKDVPAGDVGTNGLADDYAAAYADQHPDDAHRSAVITGKSPKLGGLGARAGATGLGAFTAQKTIMQARGERHVTVALQGFGNAGSWFAYYATNDTDNPVSLQAISEREGMLWTDDPKGMIITKQMVQEIGDNLQWTGPKLAALAKMIKVTQPSIELHLDDNPSKIFTFKADYFVPAAMGDVITDENVGTLGARIGINEVANGPTTAGAHQFLIEAGKVVIPDFLSNSGGVDTSITEWQANIDLAEGRITSMPNDTTVETAQRQSTALLTNEVLEMAERLETNDLRIAAAAVSISHLEAEHKARKPRSASRSRSSVAKA